jgi:ribosomal protein L11 methyltransferase
VRASWSALVLDLPAGLEDLALGCLWAESLGAESQPLPGDRARLRVFLRDPARAPAVARELLAKLSRRTRGTVRLRGIERVDDARWSERYQASLKPLPIGRRFLVDPTGRGCVRRGRLTLALVPGRAFGTGEHATTRLCVERLEELVRRGSCWADVGCGTGLLSIVARACGARTVLALDCDPVAVQVAREVLRRNAVRRGIEVRRGTEARLPSAAFHGVVANIGTAWILGAAPRLVRALRPAGLLVASGLLVTDLAEVARALGAAGLEPVARRRRGAWGVIVARKASA